MTCNWFIIMTLLILGVIHTWAKPGGHDLGTDAHKGLEHHQDYYAHPKYKYGYGVKDAKGDKKTAAEWRDGKTVKGHYSFQESDGSWRTVNYIADEKGFRAQVHRTSNHHPGFAGLSGKI